MHPIEQSDTVEENGARSLLDHLLEDARLYKSSQGYMDLLGFVAQMRNFAPFNALMLQIQKPGVQFVASKHDWRERYGSNVKQDARPLLILWPFGPVALVYDVIDVEGGRIPQDAQSFIAKGPMTADLIEGFIKRMTNKEIFSEQIDQGDGRAGSISMLKHPKDENTRGHYRLKINRNHNPNIRFVTIAHELAHLFLGHLGADKKWGISDRLHIENSQQEIEAESVAFLVAKRNGVDPESKNYLSDYVRKNDSIESLDLYQIMRAAGQIEILLGISAHTRFDPPGRKIQDFQKQFPI